MIIGISGYSGSGKDTVGAIIQYIYANQEEPLSLPVEKMVTDMDEFGLFLESESEWEIKKFAGKLKDIASHLTGIDIEDFEDQEFKKTNLGREWWTTCDEGWQPMTVRDLLQKLGTDALRTGLHPNVWVNALMADYKHQKVCDCERECRCTFKLPNWIITDTRFPNEAMAIKEKGGIIIRVDRPGVSPINAHPSEVGLDGWNFDYKIANVSDLFSLKMNVENILKHAKIL
jgi:hypothetical protein